MSFLLLLCHLMSSSTIYIRFKINCRSFLRFMWIMVFFYLIRLLYLKDFISAPCMLCDSLILRLLHALKFSCSLKHRLLCSLEQFMQFIYLLEALFNIEIGSLVDEISRSAPECVVMSYLSIEIGISVNRSSFLHLGLGFFLNQNTLSIKKSYV